MKSFPLLLLILALAFNGCTRKSQHRFTKTWTFSQTPQKHMSYHMGHSEDRTVFDGTESITFRNDGKFLVNNIVYGSWSYDKKKSVISIDQVPYQEYSCCGAPQTRMSWEILDLEKNRLIVRHSYYQYYDNQYSFK